VLPTADLLTLTVNDDLFRDLETKEWGQPLAIGTVLQESISRKEMIGLRDFAEAPDSIYLRKWIPRPWAIIGWGLKQLGLVGNEQIIGSKLVILGNIEEAAKGFEKRTEGTRSRVERIYSKSAFMDAFADVLGETKLSDSDFTIFLQYLQRDKELIAWDGSTVKLKGSGEKAPQEITAEDSTIASLKSLINDLESQTTTLEKRADEFGVAARQAVEKKNRVSALAALRSKKVAESTLTKRHATLAQLEEVFSRIERAADQVELVRVMEASTKVLAGLNKQVGGVERVDIVVDQLREQMGHVDGVGDIIAEASQAGTVDEADIDDELEALERTEREEREELGRKQKEEQEKKEAEETRKKLLELEVLDQKANRKANEQEAEEALEKSTDALSKMSLHQVGDTAPNI
jgi:charged multivesicular body protein 7